MELFYVLSERDSSQLKNWILFVANHQFIFLEDLNWTRIHKFLVIFNQPEWQKKNNVRLFSTFWHVWVVKFKILIKRQRTQNELLLLHFKSCFFLSRKKWKALGKGDSSSRKIVLYFHFWLHEFLFKWLATISKFF